MVIALSHDRYIDIYKFGHVTNIGISIFVNVRESYS
jgi:hypothetical protein